MIDVSLTPQQEDMRALARRFATERVAPVASPHDREASYPAKAYASDRAFDAASVAVNVPGGYGYVGELAAQKLMRDVKPIQIFGGTSEIQCLVIARQVSREATA